MAATLTAAAASRRATGTHINIEPVNVGLGTPALAVRTSPPRPFGRRLALREPLPSLDQ
jgi:hypothetical protein